MLSLLYGSTLTSIHDHWKNHSFDYTDVGWQSDVSAFNILSRLVIAFLPRSKCLLISWLQSSSAVILEPKTIKSITASTFPPSLCLEVMGPDARILIFWMSEFQASFFTLLFHPHQEALWFLFTFCHKGGVICISGVVDISSGNVDSSLLFIQLYFFRDVFCI